MTNKKKNPQSHLYYPSKIIHKIGFEEKKNALDKLTYKHPELLGFQHHLHTFPASVQSTYEWIMFENLFICHWLKIPARFNTWKAFMQTTIPLHAKPEIQSEQTRK